ncbi:MAG TPA: hypothetical protein VFA30_08145 [Gaiellaceae bacterium]|nr:hypothetical protein [Gaiellaceae bacterium]
MTPIHGDGHSATIARRDTSGRILVYLDAAPQEGAETLSNFPTFRIAHNEVVSKDVHRDAAAVGLRFVDAVGSCVIDRYTTRVKSNRYREIACYVQGPTTASVIVAAALESEWTRALPLLERAVSVYRAR